MTGLFLAAPDGNYQKSFECYALAYLEINDTHYYNKYKKALENFEGYLNDLHNYSSGNCIPQGEVRTSTFWLIDQAEVVGVVRIRHQALEFAGHIGYDISPAHRNKGYGFHILTLALAKAVAMGIDEVILTCNIDNTPSRKIIEKNNGELLGTVFDEEENEHLHQYRIALTNPASDYSSIARRPH